MKPLINFKFKATTAKKIRKQNDSYFKKVSRLVAASSEVDENNQLVARIYLATKDRQYLVVPFTPDSYDNQDKVVVFGVKPDEKGRIVKYIRDERHARVMPGLDTQYTPIVANQVYSGNIVRKDKKLYFQVKNYICSKGYAGNILLNKEEEVLIQ